MEVGRAAGVTSQRGTRQTQPQAGDQGQHWWSQTAVGAWTLETGVIKIAFKKIFKKNILFTYF